LFHDAAAKPGDSQPTPTLDLMYAMEDLIPALRRDPGHNIEGQVCGGIQRPFVHDLNQYRDPREAQNEQSRPAV